MMVADNGGVSRDEKNETEDLLSRRMSSGSASAAEKQSPSPLEAGNDPSTDTEAFDPITDPIAEEAPKHSATENPVDGPGPGGARPFDESARSADERHRSDLTDRLRSDE
jgi:hypothetical protein